MRNLGAILGSGYIVPNPENVSEIDSMANILTIFQSAGRFTTHSLTLVVWPAGAPLWRFLEEALPEVPNGAVIRFLALRTAPSNDLEQYEGIAAFVTQRPDRGRASSKDHILIRAIFHYVYGVEYHYLITPNNRQSEKLSDTFILCYLPVAEDCNIDPNVYQSVLEQMAIEQDQIIRFLRASGARKVITMEKVVSTSIAKGGSWEYYRKNVEHGCIIVSLPPDW